MVIFFYTVSNVRTVVLGGLYLELFLIEKMI